MPFDDDIRDLDNFEPVAKIVVIGVGGAGNNAVNRMIDENIQNVEFYVVNTDKQALASSKAAHRIVIGEEITKGLGAGGDPAMGKAAAEASKETIQKIVEGADMVFVAAGMGKGTGTGAAPVIARIAKDAGCLTVAIVTRPFTFEGPKRIENSVQGLNALKDAVDSIIIVSNDKLLMSAGNAPINMAFSESDAILCQSVRTVADLILVPAQMNLDFLKSSGVALIGYGIGKGAKKAEEAADNAINSPLLETSISGARRAICAVTCGSNVTLYEAQECVNRINAQAGGAIDIKFGVSINVIASDFTEEFDFSNTPKFVAPSKEELGSGISEPVKPVESAPLDEKEDESGIADDILPNFLKDE